MKIWIQKNISTLKKVSLKQPEFWWLNYIWHYFSGWNNYNWLFLPDFSKYLENLVEITRKKFAWPPLGHRRILILIARDPIVAPCARSCVFHVHSSLFLMIWYYNSSKFYNIVDVFSIFSKLLPLWGIHSHQGIRARYSQS